MIITDDEQINSRFDLAFYYYLVSYYTNCVQHSSDKIAKFEFTSLKLPNIYIYIYRQSKYGKPNDELMVCGNYY